MVEINEPISIVVAFGGSRPVTPVSFRWNRRVIKIKEVTFHWRLKQGQHVLHIFTASDGRNLYQLAFDPLKLRWTLRAMEALP